MQPLTARRFSRMLAPMALAVLVLGCPKKAPPPVEDAAPPPAPAATPTMTELAPLTDDAGEDAAAEAAAPKKYTGPSMTTNQLRIKECCNAMRAQAKQMGASPEAFQLNAFSQQCDVLAAQVGPAGSAPEFNQIRQMLKSIKLPVACQL